MAIARTLTCTNVCPIHEAKGETNLVRYYSRFQVAFQIAFRILVRTYVMLFCNYPTSNEFTLRNLQLCPQTSKLGSELRPIFRIHFAIFVRTPPIVSKCEISYYIYTFIVRKFQNFHDYCRPDRKR